MAELADALDLGSSSERSEGSSPFIRIFNAVIKPQPSMSEGNVIKLIAGIANIVLIARCS